MQVNLFLAFFLFCISAFLISFLQRMFLLCFFFEFLLCNFCLLKGREIESLARQSPVQLRCTAEAGSLRSLPKNLNFHAFCVFEVNKKSHLIHHQRVTQVLGLGQVSEGGGLTPP